MQNKNRIIDTESILIVAREKGFREMGEKGEGVKKYKLAVFGAVSYTHLTLPTIRA